MAQHDARTHYDEGRTRDECRTKYEAGADYEAGTDRATGPQTHSPSGSDADGSRTLRHRIETDRESVQRDLARLVLTVVELLRELMERQAIRRVDEGDLSDDQVEDLGQSLMHLEEAMAELRDHFGLSPSDLNIDLGPLGPLLPD